MQERLNEAQENKKLGNDLFKDDKYDEALEMYTKALRTCPFSFSKERSVFYSNRSVCFLKMKETEKCIKECSESIKLDPTCTKPLLRRAECYETTDKLDEAVEDYKKAVKKVAEENLVLANTGNLDSIAKIKFIPNKPVSYESSYARAIRMLELSVDTEIELELHDFDQLVQDEWQWKQAFTTSNSTYKSY